MNLPLPTTTANRGRMARVAIFLCALTLVATPLFAAQRVRVGVYENSPKIGFAANGKPEGIFIDLLEAVAAKEGWKLEYVPGTWSEGLDRLGKGEIDLMPDVALTPEREYEYAFHREPVLSSWNQVYARRGSRIRSLADLEGRRVAVLAKSVQQDLFQQMVASFGFGVRLVEAPDFDAAFEAVVDGRADAVVTNRFYGARHAATAGLEDTAIIFAPSRLYFASRRDGNRALLDAIDRHLIAWKQDSTSVYYHSLKQWSDEEVPPAIPQWLAIAMLAGIALLVTAAAWLILLRRQVNARTEIIRRRNEQLAIVNRTLRTTGGSLDPGTVLEEAIRGAMALTGCDYGILFIRDREDEDFRRGAAAYRDPLDAYCDVPPLANVSCPAAADVAAFRNRPAVVRADSPAGASVGAQPADPLVRWKSCFPLEAHRVTVGLLCLYSRQQEPPDRRDVALVQELCVPVALAIENAQLFQRARMHADELEHRVVERTRELGDAKLAAEAADRIKSAFLATMSHELRTPLNSIIGFTGIVCQGLAGPLNDEQKRQLGMVRESAQHLLALINDVLDISKIEAGELSVGFQSFDLPASVAKVTRIVGPLADKKKLALSTSIDPRVGSMVGDSRRVEQILLNLLGNAIKFTESGAVALTVDAIDSYSHNGSDPVPAVRLRVIDSGIGIQPEDMEKLFIPFRQIDSTLSRKHEGTGLGLAICHRLASLMGGHIEAESRPGEGSTFTVFLPLHPAAVLEAV